MPSYRETLLSSGLILTAILAAGGLLITNLYEIRGPIVFSEETYLPIHALSEIASIVVSFAIFAIYWNASRESHFEDPRGLFVGNAFLIVALIDSFHILSFPGMPVFVTPSSVDKGIYYWIFARLVACCGLFFAATSPRRLTGLLSRRWSLLGLSLAIAFGWFYIVSYQSAILPVMFVPGRGLAPIKMALEYLVILIAFAGIFFHLRAYRKSPYSQISEFGQKIKGDEFNALIVRALVVTVFSEFAFTLYQSAYDIHNLTGHLFKTVAYYLIFQALFVSAMRRPYSALSHANNQLDESNRELARLNDQIDNQLKRTIFELEETVNLANNRAAQLDAVIENMAEGVAIVDSCGKLLLVSRVGRELLGLPAIWSAEDSPSEQSIADLLSRLKLSYPDGQPVPLEDSPVSRALRGETFSNCELHINEISPMDETSQSQSSRQAQRIIIFGGSPVRDDSAQIVLAVTIFRDITDFRKLEERREDFTRIVAHDIRAPLTVVLGQAQLIYRLVAPKSGEVIIESQTADAQASRIAERAEAIVQSARRMNGMISDLVDSARLESGNLSLERERVDLRELVEALLHRLSGTDGAERISLDLPEESVMVEADSSLIERVYTNLITNALKYSEPGSSVRLKVERQGGRACSAVLDHGPGIPPEELEGLFQRYYRAPSSSGHHEGIGLGLYITRMLVEVHGGQIWAESEVGVGSTFAFHLPLAE